MQKQPRSLPQNSGPANYSEIYSLLSEEITDYDCGILCAPLNQGVPICCSVKFAVPLLYKSEFQYLQSAGILWKEWTPARKKEQKMASETGPHEIYCECTGPAQCASSRHLRSISCRTFPLEPYISESGEVAGLVFTGDFSVKSADGRNVCCPLKERPGDIRPEFIQNSILFWKELLRIPSEYSTYSASSRQLRRNRARSGTDFIVLKYPRQ